MVKIINFFIIVARTFKFGQFVAFGSLITYQLKNYCFGAPFGPKGPLNVKIFKSPFLKLDGSKFHTT